jgi:hypothetical protein
VKKCKGLPLAAKTIVGLLQFKLDLDEWKRILKSELWDSPIDETNILPTFNLSYKYLPSHLKQCFGYCLILPKGHVFEKVYTFSRSLYFFSVFMLLSPLSKK